MSMSRIFCFIYVFHLVLIVVLCGNIPPRIMKWKTPKEEYVPPGGAVFTCEANGTGTLDFEWYKDGLKIVTSQGGKYRHSRNVKAATTEEELQVILDGSKLKSEDEGFYQCRVKNTYGTAVSDITWLKRYHLEAGKGTEDVVARVGDSLKLFCKEKQLSSSSPNVEWLKTSTSDETSNTPVTLDERVQIDENGTLAFSYVLEEDRTKKDEVYTCVLKNSVDLITSVVGSKYRVTVDQKISDDPTSLSTMFAYVKPKITVIGRDITLGCFFGGSQQITVSFTDAKGHNLISDGQSQVDQRSKSSRTIKKVQKSHQGEYTCTGSSNHMKQAEKLQVMVQERPTFTEQPQDQNATHGLSTEFKCSAKADPPANIAWFKNGELLKEDNLPSNMYMSSDRSTLGIQNLCKEKCQGRNDLMVIQCNASNIHGYAFANGYLNILFKTEITKKPLDVEYSPEEHVIFHCDAKTDPDTKLTFKWLFEDKPFTHGSINTTNNILQLKIPDMEDKGKSLIGKWTCVASNSYTSDMTSAYLKPKYVPAYVWPYWWAVLLALLLFLLILLIICIVCFCLYQNRGDQYPVDEIEHKSGNNPEKELEEAGFHDYQRDLLLPRSDSATGTLSSQERTISRQKKSQGSLSGTLGRSSNENLSG